MKIINLTQHPATSEQVAQGVFEPGFKKAVQAKLTFTKLPTSEELVGRAKWLASCAKSHGATHAMIGGAPYLMPALERELRAYGVTPLYAFSERVSVETTQPDGAVIKTNVFKHVGFVEAV